MLEVDVAGEFLEVEFFLWFDDGLFLHHLLDVASFLRDEGFQLGLLAFLLAILQHLLLNASPHA